MATKHTNLSGYDKTSLPSGAHFKVGLVVSKWNPEITGNLLKGAKETLLELGVYEKDILISYVPGSYELALGAQWFLERKDIDGVICIGSLIQGETRHFEFVAQAVSQGIKDVSLKFSKPAIFCVLTDDTIQQAKDRSGGKYGNKGVECAVALVEMIALMKNSHKI